MGLIGDQAVEQIKKEFAQLVNPVRLNVFSRAGAEPDADQVRHLVEELAGLDERLVAESHDFVPGQGNTAELSIARTPAIAIMGAGQDYGIRFYGRPSGHEFSTLIDAIGDVSRGGSELSEPTCAALAALDRPVHLQVFSTPT